MMDDLERSLLNVFTYSDLDRKVDYRSDENKIQKLKFDPSSRYVLFCQSRFILETRPTFKPLIINADQLSNYELEIQNQIFLGTRSSKNYFAAEITRLSVEEMIDEDVELVGLRRSGERLKAQEASMLSYAKAMFLWHKAHIFCGVCGAKTEANNAGHSRKCTNESCQKAHFPRIDPAVIAAVIHDGKCLFGRQEIWPTNRYSVIAGFVEPGESVEQAVVREVLEETNISIDKVKYRSSQPWPFPGSIMLGFTATATNTDISLNDGELEDAHWRSVLDVVTGLANQEFILPPKLSIAYRLIEDWFNQHSDDSLEDVIGQYDIQLF